MHKLIKIKIQGKQTEIALYEIKGKPATDIAHPSNANLCVFAFLHFCKRKKNIGPRGYTLLDY